MSRQPQFETLSQQVAKERQCVVQLHLFIAESQAEGHRAQCVPAQTQRQNSPQCQTQAYSIVPEWVKGYEHVVSSNTLEDIVEDSKMQPLKDTGNAHSQ